MDIEKNTTYACRVVRINGEEVDYLSALEIDYCLIENLLHLIKCCLDLK